MAKANQRRKNIDAGLFDFICDVLTLGKRGALESEFLLRFQQFTSPVMAKGVEDTAYYCFNRMTGLNEVGGAPSSNGIDIQEFHRYCMHMQASHPRSLIRLRRSTPELNDSEPGHARTRFDEERRWLSMQRGPITLLCNLGETMQSHRISAGFSVLLSSRPEVRVNGESLELPPDTVVVLRSS